MTSLKRWIRQPPLVIAHQGGAAEAPSSTLFAFATAVANGADMLELDVHATADGHLVVLHDDTVDRTTDGTGRIDAMTLDDVQRLDGAYWFVPDHGVVHDRQPGEYSLRGIATGRREPPEGFSPADFVIPTLADVLATITAVPVNIDIKRTSPQTVGYEELVADAIRRCLRTHDVMIASFADAALKTFRTLAPGVATSAGPDETTQFWAYAHGHAPRPAAIPYQALQVPPVFAGVKVVTEELVAAAHALHLAVHVWTIDDQPTMHRLLELGVDGIVTDRPTVARSVVAARR